MTDIESRVRSSLQRRADDVEATPVLYEVVRRRLRRRRWWITGGAVAAAAAVVAAVVVAVNLQGVQGPAAPEIAAEPDTPTAPAGEQVLPPLPSLPLRAVVTDGTSLRVVFTASGTPADGEVYTVEDGAEIVSVTAHPEATGEDLTVAVVVDTGGTFELRTVEVVDGEERQSEVVFTVGGGDVELSAVWAADGSYLAYATAAGGRDTTVVSALPWPRGQQRPELAADIDGHVRLLDWTGDTPSTDVSTLLVERDGRIGLATLPAADDTDPPETPLVDELADGVLAAAFARGGSPPQRVELVRTDGGLALAVRNQVHIEGRDTLPLPEEFPTEVDVDSVWMDAHYDGVLLGAGQQAWVVGPHTADEPVRALSDPVSRGSLLLGTAPFDFEGMPPSPPLRAHPGPPPCPVELTVDGEQAGDTVHLTATATLTGDTECSLESQMGFQLKIPQAERDDDEVPLYFYTEGTAAGGVDHQLTPDNPTVSFTARWSNWCRQPTPTVEFSAGPFGETTTKITPPPCQSSDQQPQLDDFQITPS